MTNVYNTLQDSAKKWPTNMAVVDEYGQISFSELASQTEVLKNYLLEHGIGKGMAVGIITSNSRYFIMSLYAGVACGALVMPISNIQKNKEIEDAIIEAQLHVLITDSYELASFGQNISEIKLFNQTLYISHTKRDKKNHTANFIPDAAFMRFTSGTTGKAKGVVVSHKSAIERVDAANEALKLNEQDRVVWVLPMAYHFVVSIVLYIKYGVGIIINDNFLAESIIQIVNNYKGTFLYAAPMHIKLLASYKPDVELSMLKKVISTTTAISADVCKAFETKYNLPVSQAYGIIEIGLPIINLNNSVQHPEAVGYALPAYTVEILDDNFNVVENETIGRLAIKGPGMFNGYLSPPTLRENVLQHGWFMTGDYALKKIDGLLIVKGREKNVINVSGNKVFPNEVEEVINGYKGIVTSKAFSKVHPLMGEVVAVDIIIEKDAIIDIEELRNYCKQTLSSFKLPQFINVVDKIEMTDSGKVKRA
ncbi:MAG TPA: class I adenylate-forming enzyme family protein [Bacteroidia bacterium]|nr:class I adenylate-forming enzyme family protein [Bacteroidia bacterium]